MSARNFSPARLRRLRDGMAGFVERGEVPGLVTLVSRRGETHVEAMGALAFGGGAPMRRDAIFRIASLSKPVAAAAAMILVEECRLRLDEPVDRLLPELADRRVLKKLDSPLDDTVPAKRPISLRDLLTLRMGLGYIMDPAAGDDPIQKALREHKILQGPPQPQSLPPPDEWLRRVASLPLMSQPGEKWMYDLGIDVVGVLIARAAGQPLETFLHERLFAPLGMKDTGFSVPAEKIDRLTTCYWNHPATGELEVYDEAAGGQWSLPPAFPAAAGGLVSTLDDYFAFSRMLLNQGRHDGERILSRATIETMTTDQLTAAQKAASGLIDDYFDSHGWGFGMAVVTRRTDLSEPVGRFGWDGGLGTSWAVDPRNDMTGILMTQRAWASPVPPNVCRDFWTLAYQAIED
jgi:CubicO group peptidase (beta-lactamase class C family)